MGQARVRESFFTNSAYYTGPHLTDAMVRAAEARLGFTLPTSYVQLLRERNGGVPRRRCIRSGYATSWAPDHVEIAGILGIGGPRGIDTPKGPSSQEMIQAWGYPPIGVVICDTPSAGHDTVMLDYSGPQSEPSVVYVDEDREPKLLAATFSTFIEQLRDCQDFEQAF